MSSPKDSEAGYLVRTFSKVWHCKGSPPMNRISGAYGAAMLLTVEGRWEESSSFSEGAVELLSKVSPRFLRRNDQEHMLSDFTQLIARAVSVALEVRAEASYCLRLLEFGRGIIMGLAIDCRRDLSELRLRHPDVFNKFDLLRNEINFPLTATQEDRHRRLRREKVTHDIEEMLACIRQLPVSKNSNDHPLQKTS